MIELPQGWAGEAWFVAALLLLTVIATLVMRWARLELGWQAVTAVLRAALQLGVVALVLSGVLSTPWTVALFILLMLTTASLTSARRLTEVYQGRRGAVLGVLAASLLTVVLVFALHLMDWTVRYLIAVAGIIIGNAMAGATLVGRTFHATARERAGEIEGWLALGATPPVAHDDIGRQSVREMLIPSVDQTKSTGLVTLPGAFVGAIMGGASPVEAAKFQLVVLAGILLAKAVSGIVVARVAGRSPFVPYG
ncbi:ABC transporter permease [Marihabitans asiaticum]|uniref:Putative ABC transport system permease protein n=1 Tax=Marihabitans asiaticum TaxID=415218 RepID=A0A560W9X8_9MICO|nr:ABC transporter permease [Marihabitans asiaticum]TWD14428.1 putative ABC transport system permease protein [Marihabitans asiaticum]